MKNNNGKIAIAIVAMFVVALSIVGFTYAYFTATVTGNNSTEESVKVTAGSMIVSYDGGDTLTANNVVPGWFNDGKHYYDTVHSVTVVGNESRVSAVSTDDFAEGGKLAGKTPTPTTPAQLEAYGLTEPVEFSVKNTGDNTAAYALDMQVLANNITDKSHLTFTLYAALNQTPVSEGSTPAYTEVKLDLDECSDPETDEPTAVCTLNAQGQDHKLYQNVNLAAGKVNYYKIIFHYAEADEPQNLDQTKTPAFQTKMVVTGLDQRSVTE